MSEWHPELDPGNKPLYRAIADAIAFDIRSGRLAAEQRLPPQRKLAARLGLDFTTVARGYGEAQRRPSLAPRDHRPRDRDRPTCP